MGTESSSAYFLGYTVHVVLTILDKTPYSLEIVYSRDMRGSYNGKASVKPLKAWKSFLYIGTASVQEFLKARQLRAKCGIVAEGGPLPDGAFYFATTHKR